MDSEIIKKHIENFLSLQQVKEIIENSGKNKLHSKIFINVENESENSFVLEINSDKAQGFSGFRKKYSFQKEEENKILTEEEFYSQLSDECIKRIISLNDTFTNQCKNVNMCKQCYNVNNYKNGITINCK